MMRPSAELLGFEGLGEAEYLARIAADDELVRVLQLGMFNSESNEWRLFSQALAEYGYAVFRAWFGTGEIVRRLVSRSVRGRGILPLPFDVPEDDVAELTAELIIRGIRSFRENVLLQGRWKADGGASLKTYFVGHLLFLVPATFKGWQQLRGVREVADPTRLVDDKPEFGMTDRVEARMLLVPICASLSERELRMFELQAAGRTVQEIASVLNVSVSKIKTDMMRARQRMAQRYPEVAEWAV